MTSSKLRAICAVALLLGAGMAGAETVRVNLVERESIEGRLREFGGSNIERGARLRQMFVDAGCREHLTDQPVRWSKSPNIICVLPGTTDRVLIVGAHFDRVRSSAGVADNWSGASLLPSLYAALNIEPRQHTYVFIGFTDEEKGLVGSSFYARKMSREQIDLTDAMINLDTLGLSETKVWSHRADKRLLGALIRVAKVIDVPLAGVNFETAGYSTDSESFDSRKIPRLTIHSLTQKTEDSNILHTSKDKLSAMNLDYYYDTYHLTAVYLAFLDGFVNE
jgi:Iap family predicted aminopeptidase